MHLTEDGHGIVEEEKTTAVQVKQVEAVKA
jgi:hypothetical protein